MIFAGVGPANAQQNGAQQKLKGDNSGTKATARIAGQREGCLIKALHDYKSGARSGGGMAAMADVAYPLSEEEITALAHYLAGL